MGKFHTYIFDLGGVINNHDNPRLIATLLSKCDDRASEDALISRFCDDAYATGERSVIEFHEMLKHDFGYALGWKEFCEDWCCHLSMREGMLEYLDDLRKTARVLFLSNTNLIHWTKLLELSRFELASYEAFLSFDMGLAKPSKAIFEKVISAAKINTAGALFVDDREENVAQAKKCGLAAILYEGQKKFLLSLADFH